MAEKMKLLEQAKGMAEAFWVERTEKLVAANKEEVSAFCIRTRATCTLCLQPDTHLQHRKRELTPILCADAQVSKARRDADKRLEELTQAKTRAADVCAIS